MGSHPDLGDRYLASDAVERYSDARSFNESAPPDERFQAPDITRWQKASEDAKDRFGADLGRPRGWAKPLFPQKKGMIQIPDLEELADFSAHRSFYRYANHEVHGTARGGTLNQYISNDGTLLHSTGRSHRGLAEPISMASVYTLSVLVDLLMDTGDEPSTIASLTVQTLNLASKRLERMLHIAHEAAEGEPFVS
ncbi:hypothetical protein VN1338_24370 [Helicobacter pylori]